MELAEKTLMGLLQVSAERAELECGRLARELIEASIEAQRVSGNEKGESVPLSLFMKEDIQHLVADEVQRLDVTSPEDAVRIIDALEPIYFDRGQKQLGRVLVFLVLVVILVQRVTTERTSEAEVSLMSECVARCLCQHREAWVHHPDIKWDYLTILTSGALLMTGALIGTILLKK